jgi:AmiR/NasT family two-component response regulator
MPVKCTRVLVASRPRLLHSLIAAIAGQPDIEVIGELQNEDELREAVEETRPDVLILALEDANKRVAQCGFLVGRYPQMKILALAPQENRGVFYWAVLDLHTTQLESSEVGLLRALRERPSLIGAART